MIDVSIVVRELGASTWKVLGLAGTVCFANRWLVQLRASRRASRSVTTPTFWLMSLCGSLLLLAYFALGPHRDVVGIFSNLFPMGVAGYNLSLHMRRAGSRGTHEESRTDS